ncbi:MFS transporter [Corynebacterium glyciniphilum]|uniref:MFS transporter n=1 Tax=Corynebacterium glyciniphilum TaxID=1404244 RepID=UPI002650E34E|nr:MFS transporter [Corynebacterium glyciniphilum]MDN6706888.1 MFS transporter [Corynebacterium glyciniphilum]
MSRSANRVYGLMGADGARESGLTALMYTSIANFAVDAVLAVSLAGTLFFSAAEAESRASVAAYLLVTIAPFALLAPLIGPALDRIRTGRRLALSLTFAGRVILAAVLLQNFNSWMLYPAALGMLVLSKSYGVLKSSVTPRVAPEALDLVRANARLTIAGHIGGSLVAGGLAAAIAYVVDPQAALWLLMVVALSGIYGCALIPSTAERGQDEVTVSPFVPEDPVPASGVRRGRGSEPMVTRWRRSIRVRFPDAARTCMWATALQRCGTGFMTIYVAFVAKSSSHLSGVEQLSMLAVVGAAGGVGTFAGNALGSRIRFARPQRAVLVLGALSLGAVVCAAVWDGMVTAAVATAVMSLGSAMSKVCLDAAIQSGLDQAAQASAFGMSETALQLSWVFGGTLGILLPPELTVGMAVLAVVGTVMYANVIAAARGVGLGALIGRARSPR